MAWNTEETRRRLRDAAVLEFAEHGFGAARVDRIAKRAKVNKERIYGYFGDKEGLFAAVLEDELAKAAAAVPLASLELEDVGEFAGRVFDYHAKHPHLARLLQWEALTFGDREVPNEKGREGYYREKVRALAAAQRAGRVAPEPEAALCMFLILSIAFSWFAMPQVLRMLTGHDEGTRARRARQREAVVEAARRLVVRSPAQGAAPVP